MTSMKRTASDAARELNASDPLGDDGLYERAISAAAQHYLAGDNLLAGVCERIAEREMAARARRVSQ